MPARMQRPPLRDGNQPWPHELTCLWVKIAAGRAFGLEVDAAELRRSLAAGARLTPQTRYGYHQNLRAARDLLRSGGVRWLFSAAAARRAARRAACQLVPMSAASAFCVQRQPGEPPGEPRVSSLEARGLGAEQLEVRDQLGERVTGVGA